MKKTVTTFANIGKSHSAFGPAEKAAPGWPVLELEVECKPGDGNDVSETVYSVKIVKIHGQAVEEVKKYALVYVDLSCSCPKFDTLREAEAAAKCAWSAMVVGAMEYTLQDGAPVASRFIPKADIEGEK